MKRILSALAITAILSTAVPGAALAQYMPPYTPQVMPQYMPVSPVPPIDPLFWRNIPPPMDMTWGIESQIELWRRGQLTVQAAFNLCLRLSQMVRQSGRDPGNCGATPQSLQASITALSQQYERNNRAAATNSQITNDAIQRTCSVYWNPVAGRNVVYCP